MYAADWTEIERSHRVDYLQPQRCANSDLTRKYSKARPKHKVRTEQHAFRTNYTPRPACALFKTSIKQNGNLLHDNRPMQPFSTCNTHTTRPQSAQYSRANFQWNQLKRPHYNPKLVKNTSCIKTPVETQTDTNMTNPTSGHHSFWWQKNSQDSVRGSTEEFHVHSTYWTAPD